MIHTKLIIFITLCCFAFSGCKDKWDDHYNATDSKFKTGLLQQIKSQPELSVFYLYLVKTGYDKVLSSSQQYTVWAPTNDAMAGIDQSVVNDSLKLRQLIGNHICLNAYYFKLDSITRIERLNGKYVTLVNEGLTVEGASLIEPYDRPSQNGVLHEINKVMQPVQNNWEFLSSDQGNLNQVKFINSLFQKVFDVANSKVVKIENGFTVYDTVWVQYNSLFANTGDLSNETAQYTFVSLSDDAYNTALSTVRPYSTLSTSSMTDSMTAVNVNSALVFKGKYTLQNLPDTLVAVDGTKVHLSSANITNVKETSNGAVISMNAYPVELKKLIKPIILEGENATIRTLSGGDDFRNKIIRANAAASGSYDFAFNYGNQTSALWVQFTTPRMFSVKYKLSLVAASYVYNFSSKYSTNTTANVDTTINFENESVSILPSGATKSTTPYISFSSVRTTDGYVAQSIGEFTPPFMYSAVCLRVTGGTQKVINSVTGVTPLTTGTYATAISVDYIRMDPVFE